MPASLAMARQLGSELAEAGLVVVSGLARGIDGAAHAGALDGAGRTIAVLGCGLDVVYPPSTGPRRSMPASRRARQRTPAGGAPCPRHFPLRNRIISGLSRAVVVVEAIEKSGSLITARLALEQGRDVLAVPGGVPVGKPSGMPRPYKGWRATGRDCGRRPRGDPAGAARSPADRDDATPCNQVTWKSSMAPGEPYRVDELAAVTGRHRRRLLVELATAGVGRPRGRQAGGQFAACR